MSRTTLVGIEIGGTKLQLVRGTAGGQILERRRLAVEAAAGASGIRGQIQSALGGLLQGDTVGALGVGFGGPVDWETGRICRSHQIEGWSEFDLGGWLATLSGLPVRVDNDANVAALGEALHGAGKGLNPVFYVTLGSGVGGGLVADGRIYHGAKPGEAEIGHVRLDRQGTIVEARCAGWAVDRRLRELAREHPTEPLARLLGKQSGGEARHLVSAIEQGDRSAQQVLEETAADLAFGLSHAVHLLHPAVIVLGGGLSRVGEPLRAAVQRQLQTGIMDAFAPGPPITLAALGEDAVPVGALALAQAAN